MKLHPTEPIALLQGKPPGRLTRLNYLKDKKYRGIFDKNPFYK